MKIQAKEQLPDVKGVIAANKSFLEQNPKASIPRGLGFHNFSIGDSSSTRLINSYSQWIYQRAYDYYHSLHNDDKRQADELLTQIGSYDFFQESITHPVARKYGQLELVAKTVSD